MKLIFVTFIVVHFEILGKDFNLWHSLNNLLISVTFSVFHFEISGKDSNEEQP